MSGRSSKWVPWVSERWLLVVVVRWQVGVGRACRSADGALELYYKQWLWVARCIERQAHGITRSRQGGGGAGGGGGRPTH